MGQCNENLGEKKRVEKSRPNIKAEIHPLVKKTRSAVATAVVLVTVVVVAVIFFWTNDF